MVYHPITDFDDTDFDGSSTPIRDFPADKPEFSLAINPATLAFAATASGQSSNPNAVVITNDGVAELEIISINVYGDFELAAHTIATLAPGESVSVSVTFKPRVAGPATGALYVSAPNAVGDRLVALSGSTS